jgi:hypothetical protein
LPFFLFCSSEVEGKVEDGKGKERESKKNGK